MKAKASKKHAKPTRQAKGGKFHHKMKHHFDDGGDIDVGDIDMSSPNPMPNIDDAMSRGTAYKMARAAGKKTFKWRGNLYTTESAEEAAARKAASAPSAPSDASFTYAPGSWRDKTASAPSDAPTQRPGMSIPTPPSKGAGGRDYSDPFSMRPSVDPEEYDQQAQNEGTLGRMGTIASLAPIGLGERAAVEGAGFIGKEGMVALKALKQRGQLARNLRKVQDNRPIQDVIRDATARGAGYKKGGKIHKYATGGSIRGSGCESKGKTKGTHR